MGERKAWSWNSKPSFYAPSPKAHYLLIISSRKAGTMLDSVVVISLCTAWDREDIQIFVNE